ncbi:MAG: hypothetical protein QG584_1300, partial [Pseudomonadota bacterium]|nr:hypothetical protein [Pseudomonadota bacterium]
MQRNLPESLRFMSARSLATTPGRFSTRTCMATLPLWPAAWATTWATTTFWRRPVAINLTRRRSAVA